MKIRIGDRVRNKESGLWGTVVYIHQMWRKKLYMVFVDERCAQIMDGFEMEKLPRYRGKPEAIDMTTAHRHLQEYLR